MNIIFFKTILKFFLCAVVLTALTACSSGSSGGGGDNPNNSDNTKKPDDPNDPNGPVDISGVKHLLRFRHPLIMMNRFM